MSEVNLDSRINIRKYLCSCGELLLKCPFYLELERRVNSLGSSFSLLNWKTNFSIGRYRWSDILLVRPLRSTILEKCRDQFVRLWPGYRKAIDVIGKRNVNLAKAVLSITGKQVFVDAQKDPIRMKFLNECDGLDLYVIHLVRDVRGVVCSMLKHKIGNDVNKLARSWRITNMNVDRARRYVSPHRWLQITYDDICSDAQGTIDRISDFVGVERAALPKNFYENEHHIIGNIMRKGGSGVIKRDESWKLRLKQHDLDAIARIGGIANRYFGHDWPNHIKL